MRGAGGRRPHDAAERRRAAERANESGPGPRTTTRPARLPAPVALRFTASSPVNGARTPAGAGPVRRQPALVGPALS